MCSLGFRFLPVLFFFISGLSSAHRGNAETVGEAIRPNVVLIYTDDQGFGDVSALNQEAKFKTPNMDRLAKEGIAFTDAHCSDTVCTPSRYGLLTGRYCWRTVKKVGVMGAEGKCLIADDRLTIPKLLRRAGYRTAMIGKWHLGMDFPGSSYKDRDWTKPTLDMPLDKGFDFFFGIPASLNYGVLAWFRGRMAAVPPTLFTAKKPNQRHLDYRIMPPYQDTPENTAKVLGKKGMEVAPDFVDNQCLTRFTDEAINWMRVQHRDKPEQPFFVYLPFTSPHYPVCPLPEFHGKGEAGGYGEFVLETDYHVGRILAALEEMEIDENTLILFTSDNGPEKSWKERVQEFDHHSNGIFREGKRSIYEGGHRVPFLVRWPAGIASPGRNCDATVCQTDILATLGELCAPEVEIASDAGEDSQSFLAVLQSKDCQHERLPTIHHASNGQFAIREGKWKLVMEHRKSKAELYNLELDPSEKRNVIEDHRSIQSDLKAKITKIVAQGRTTAGITQNNDTGYWEDLAWMTPAEYDGEAVSAEGK